MKSLIPLLLLSLAPAFAQESYKRLLHHWDYDRSAPLNYKEGAVHDREGVKVYDISYTAPLGDRSTDLGLAPVAKNRTVTAYLVLPSGQGPFPAVIYGNWCMPGSEKRNRTEFLDEAVMLAHSGVISLLPDHVSFHPSFVEEYSWPINEILIAETVQQDVDLRRGADLLVARKDVDSKRMAYVGHGCGAIAGGLLSGIDKRFKAFVIMAGRLSDEVLKKTKMYHDFRQEMGPEELDAVMSAFSWTDPAKYVSRAAPAAMFLQYATDEPSLSGDMAKQYLKIVNIVSEPKKFKMYRAPHALNAQATQDRVAFLAGQLRFKPPDAKTIAALPVLVQPPWGAIPDSEAAPEVTKVANSGNVYARPLCIAPDGTEYYGIEGVFEANREKGEKDRRIFYNDPPKNDVEWTTNFDYLRPCAVKDDGTVYVLAKTPHAGWLGAYTPLGELRWTVPLPSSFSALALSRRGVIYLTTLSQDGRGTNLLALSGDGATLWELQIGARHGAEIQWGSVEPVVGPTGTIYAIADNKEAVELIAVSPEGQKLWRVALDSPARVSQLIAGPDDSVYLNVPGKVIAFNSRGQQLWQFSSCQISPDYDESDGGIALAANGTLYFASELLYALDASGRAKWSFKSDSSSMGDYFEYRPVIAEDGTIYAVSYEQELYAISPEGRKLWHLSGGGPRNPDGRWEQITLRSDGILITPPGRIKVPTGLAKSGWPAENGNNSNRRSLEGRQ